MFGFWGTDVRSLRKVIVAAIILMLSIPAKAAGGSTADVVPTKVEIVRNEGFMIFGSFGNPGATPCSRADGIWVARTHTQYTELLSTALSAVAGQLKLQAYVHYCSSVGWHGGTWNQLSDSGALYISR